MGEREKPILPGNLQHYLCPTQTTLRALGTRCIPAMRCGARATAELMVLLWARAEGGCGTHICLQNGWELCELPEHLRCQAKLWGC